MTDSNTRWEIPRGDTRTRPFSVTVDGVAQDLQGYTVRLEAVPVYGGGAAFSWETTVAIGAPATAVDVTLGPAQTSAAGIYAAAVRAERQGHPGPWTLPRLEVVIVGHPAA